MRQWPLLVVSALDGSELFYANSVAQELFTKRRQDKLETFLCAREPMQVDHLSEPGVPFQPMVRERYHPASNRTYQLRSSRVNWNGKPAYLEYITETTG